MSHESLDTEPIPVIQRSNLKPTSQFSDQKSMMAMRQKQSRFLVSILSSSNLPGMSPEKQTAKVQEENTNIDRGYQYFPEQDSKILINKPLANNVFKRNESRPKVPYSNAHCHSV